MLNLQNQADLTKLIDLCRKKGVVSIKLSENACEMTLAPELPESPYRRKKSEKEISDTPAYSEEQALFWSSTSIPEGASQ